MVLDKNINEQINNGMHRIRIYKALELCVAGKDAVEIYNYFIFQFGSSDSNHFGSRKFSRLIPNP